MESDAIVVAKEEEGLRLDKLLALRYPAYSRTYFQYLIQSKLVLVNGEQVKKRVQPKEEDEIEIEFALTPEISLEPEPIPLTILYEDEDLVAINKPSGLVVHPGAGNWSGTFVNALLYHCQQLPRGENLRPGIVHRLDKETSGVLIAAKNERAQIKLVEGFATRQIKKEYVAICIGKPKEGLITGNIGRHPQRRKEMTVVQGGGKEARTHVQLVAYGERLSVVRLLPETGRTHQLRVHLKHMKTPILGDKLYGNLSLNKKYGAERQLLHAALLRFAHPRSQKMLELEAPIPDDIQRFIDKIG